MAKQNGDFEPSGTKMHKCPKCKRCFMGWDGRAKVFMCYGNTCNHVIRNRRYFGDNNE